MESHWPDVDGGGRGYPDEKALRWVRFPPAPIASAQFRLFVMAVKRREFQIEGSKLKCRDKAQQEPSRMGSEIRE